MICSHCQEFKPLERTGLCASCSASIRKAERMNAPEDGKPIAMEQGFSFSRITTSKD